MPVQSLNRCDGIYDCHDRTDESQCQLQKESRDHLHNKLILSYLKCNLDDEDDYGFWCGTKCMSRLDLCHSNAKCTFPNHLDEICNEETQVFKVGYDDPTLTVMRKQFTQLIPLEKFGKTCLQNK